ncbi:uncharacterized protein LOC118223123 isoform X3 [Anguilla anguilla]|uniref:uncharacterized protein LOC118223123 isoform X3 n=1 Tax=Anguilla anguilla TaxID=7936 RepID=UPI0015A8CB10|nr:uncharacterized protein LOC118223123 isoform X3 [Anguilla anguilla]
MEQNILILVGFPDDFASVKPRLELYFRNKRKSGGEVSEIRNYPNDKRKALLVYTEDEALQRVLKMGPHKVDFKALGVVELQVKSLEADDIAKVKIMNPVPLPKPRLEKKIGSGKSACDIEAKPGPFHQEGLQQDGGKKVLSLLVSSDCPIKEEILQVYFEQFTDDVDICGHGDNQWILKLTSHSDLENILAKKDHVLEGSLMSMQLYDEREAEDPLDPHRFILSGFSEDCKCSHLSVFIKSCSRGAEHSWEVLNDGQRIAVTFKQDIDVQAFLKKCFANKLQSMDISASRLEYTDSVLVKGNMENITEKELRDYFSSPKSNGGQIKYLIWVENAKSVLLEFEDFHVAHRVAKEKHTICGVSLCAFLFYCNLNQVLTGETPTTPPFPPKISIPVDALFLEYIKNDEECKEDFESTLKEHYTSFSFKGDPESPQVVLEMAVDRESLLLHHLAHTWERKTKQAVEGLLEKYSIVMLVSTEEVWERVKNKCLSLNLKTARVSFERAKNTIVVLGQQNDVKKLQGEIQLLLNKAKEELDVETNTVERKIPLDSKEEFGFVWTLVSEKLEGVENLKDEANLTFHLKGLEEKVNEAERIIKNTKDNLSVQTLHLSPNLAKFLQSLDLKKFERNHFTHITATVFSCGDSIQILAEKLQDGEKAREKIKEVLMEDVISLTPDQGKVTQEEHWRVFYSGLMQEVESSNNEQNVKISHSDVQIAVCGFQNVVTDVARKLRGYLNNKMPVAEDTQLKSPREFEYVADCMKLSEAAEIKALDVTILSSQTQATPCLKVTAANDKIKEAMAAVVKQVSHIVHEKHIYSDAGVSKVLEKHQDALKSRAKEFACKLYPTVERASQTGLEKGYRSPDSTDTLSGPPANKSQKVAPPPPLPKPRAGLKVVISGVTVILKKGDITKEAVDAILISTNSSMNLDTGVSGAILKAAGKSVVDECAKLGTQKEDGVVVTGGGNLKCKHIIQMVGPTTTAGITTSTERVLQLCESKSITSMAVPAIGTGKSNINPEESIKAILNGLQKHLSQTTSTSIKFIFIVAFEQKVFDSFQHYFAERNQQSQQRTEKPGPFHQEGLQQDGGKKVLSLLVSSDCPIKEEILQVYFEQFTDDVDICGHGDNQWILKLTSHSDLENILAKKDHVLEGCLMSVQLYDEREAEESLDPHRFILSGFSEDCKCSHLSVFIKSCSRGAEHSWEVLNDGQRIAVTFKQDIDVQAFLKKCFANKLQSMDISASRLEYTDSVLVKGNMENITEKELRDYFSSTKSNGGQIKYLIWVENAKSVLLEFEDFHVAHRVAKEKHTICGVSLCAFLFYCNLNQVLTGETPTTPPFPPKISIPVDALFLEYIQNDEECKEDFESTLKEHYTSFSFKGDPESPQVVLEMAVDRESLLLHHLAHTWERNTKQAVEGLLEKYSIVMLVSTEEVWERVKDKCLSLNLKTARVSFERAKNTIVVLGQQNDVKKLQGEIQLLLNKAKEELDVETNTVERKIPLDSKEEFGFVWNLVSEKLEGVENLKDEANLTFHLKGLEEKVNEAERIIKNTKDNLSVQTLHLSPNLAKFLQSLDLKKFERNHFTHITATVFSCGDSIQILAEKLQDGEKAREKIKEVLMEDVISLTPDQGKVTQEEHWRVFYSGLMQEVESSNNEQNVKISHSDVQIAVCGFQNVVTDVARKLREYLNNKMPVAEDTQLKSQREVEYVADCMKLSEAAEIKALDVTILSSRTQATPCLKVTAANDKIKEAMAAVVKQVSQIVHEKHIYSDAGVSKVLEKHQDALKARAKEFACKLYPTVEQASQTGLEKGYRSPDSTDTLSGPPANKSQKVAPPPPLPKPRAGLKVVIGGVTVILKKGDITKEAVDAILNSTNCSLNLGTGVSGAILKAAGKSVVDECAKLGTQKEDGVVVTGGGNLKCKHIIQMVGPTTTVGITTSTERVLQLCESKSITSMAVPAIGTGKSNINPEESIKAILKGLQKHLSQTTSTSIKFIFIVAFEQKVFDSFQHYFAERNQQSQQRTEKPGPFHQEGLQQDGGEKVLSLLVSSDCPIKKEILQLYFEQFTDDIDICGHGDTQWILKLTSHSDLENILAKKDHVLEGSLMSVQLYDEREAKERLDPHRFILSGFSEDCKCSHLSVFIKSCSRGAEHSWEVLNDGQRIAVTFKQDIDVQAFLKKCFAKKLQSMDITASRLEYTDSVLVKGNMENITEKELRDYFSSTKSNGGQIKYLIWVENAKSVLLEFEDFHVAHRVAKEKHTICGVSLCALLFYSCLKQALTGETPTTPPFPPKISIPVDALFLEYIQNDEECKEDFESTLKEHYTSFSFKGDPESPQVVLEIAVDRDSLLLHHLAHTWERKTKQAVEGLLEKYSIVMLVSTEEVWERVKDKCLSLNYKTARVFFERAKNTIVVLGQQIDVKKLQGEIQLSLNKAKEELDVEMNTVERKIPLDSKEEFGFVWNLVSEKLNRVENLKDEANLTFHLKGLEEKVNEAERIIKNTKDNLSIQTLHLSPNLAKFLQSLDLKKFEHNHFTHITATIFSCGDSIQILAEKLQDGEKAREKIKEVLMEDVISLTPDQGKVTQEEHWRVFYSGLMQEVESSNNAQNVKISHSDAQIAVCGFQNVVTDVARKLRGYLNNKMPVTEDILLKSLRQVEYVADCMKLSEAAEIKALDVTILSSRTQATPCLKVTAANDKIKEAVAAVKKHISHIVHEKHIYSDAGESKVLEKHQDALKARAKEFACKLYLTVEQASQTCLEKAISGIHLPSIQSRSTQLPANQVKIHGIRIEVKKGDITTETVRGIVNTTNNELNRKRGVSGAIFRAAGSSVEQECKMFGPQQDDGVVVTSGGALHCDFIIHMVGPLSLPAATSQVEKVLEQCEKNDITTVSFPAIGTGGGQLDAADVIDAMLQGFNSHLLQQISTVLKLIYIVVYEDKILQEFLQGLKQWSRPGLDNSCDEGEDEDEPPSFHLPRRKH